MLERVLSIVLQSGRILKEHWDQPRQVRHKGRIDLVTQSDVAVEQFLKEHLKDVVPGAQFLAEESASPELFSALQADGQAYWIIDPLDGTTNFVHGIPAVGTSVALWREGRVELGIINMPILGECFHARRGSGAWSGDVRLHVSSAVYLQESVVATGFPYDVPAYLPDILGWLGGVLPVAQGVRRMGAAAVDMAFVAAGRLDAFYEADLKPWDVAAGWLLVEEAGGRVSTLTEQPYRFGEVIVASNGRVHQELCALLRASSSTAAK